MVAFGNVVHRVAAHNSMRRRVDVDGCGLYERLRGSRYGGPAFYGCGFRCGISCRFDFNNLTDAQRIVGHAVPRTEIVLRDMVAFGNVVHRVAAHNSMRRRVDVDGCVRRNVCTRNGRCRRRNISRRRINRRALHRRHIRRIAGRSRAVRRCSIGVVVNCRRRRVLHT